MSFKRQSISVMVLLFTKWLDQTLKMFPAWSLYILVTSGFSATNTSSKSSITKSTTGNIAFLVIWPRFLETISNIETKKREFDLFFRGQLNWRQNIVDNWKYASVTYISSLSFHFWVKGHTGYSVWHTQVNLWFPVVPFFVPFRHLPTLLTVRLISGPLIDWKYKQDWLFLK